MGTMDGLETAGELRRRGFDGYLIFTTVLQEMVSAGAEEDGIVFCWLFCPICVIL